MEQCVRNPLEDRFQDRMRVPKENLTALLLIAFIVLTAWGCARPSAPRTAKLDAASCRQAGDEETKRLPDEWRRFLAHVKVCEIADGNGGTPLRVVAISAEDYYAGLPAGAETVDFPKPILFDADHDPVGALPYGFPDDPPFALDVTFVDWSDGWPSRIDLFLHDPTVSGDHALPPLVWDATARRFLERK
jgi:hypothetical protein